MSARNNDSDLFFWEKVERRREPVAQPESKQSIQQSVPVRKTKIVKRSGMSGSAKAGLKPGWTRATFIVREDYLKSLKAQAYWDRKDLKSVIDEAFKSYLSGKKIKEIPDSK